MNAREIIENSTVNQLGIKDTDCSLDGTKTFSDIKDSIAKAINVIDEALPKMKAAGVDMQKASVDCRGIFRSIIRKGWGGAEVEFYVIHKGHKAITAIGPRHLDGIVRQISEYVLNY
jgi:hypothetical protein